MSTITYRSPEDTQASYWIGLTDRSVEGSWEWVSGEEVEFQNWLSGEPTSNDHVAGPEDFAVIHSNSDNPKWIDVANSNSFYRGWGWESLGIAEISLGSSSYIPESSIDFYYSIWGVDGDFKGWPDPQNREIKADFILGDSVDHDARYDLSITADVLDDFILKVPISPSDLTLNSSTMSTPLMSPSVQIYPSPMRFMSTMNLAPFVLLLPLLLI